MGRQQLLGAEVSYYTGKVRAYLRYKRIDFEETVASREVYQQIILPRTGIAMIPVLISDDDIAVQDSTDIIDFLEARYPQPPVYPEGPVQRLVALLLEIYGDEWLVIPAMHYRWSFTENRAFAIEEFGRLSVPDAEPEAHREIGEKVARPFAGALPPLGVSGHTAPGIERSYLAFLKDFEKHLEEHPFLLGTRPSIGDFGLYGPLYAHLYRDPYSGRLMKKEAPSVAAWVERMRDPGPDQGDFLAEDHLAETLQPILQRMFEEQGPVLADTMQRLAEWAREEHERLPRAIGMHDFSIGGERGQRAVFPYSIWMWQRAYDHYHTLSGKARERADALLKAVGGYELINQPIPQRVKRENNRLMLA